MLVVFGCPKCGKEMRPVGVSEAWNGGGAELFYCSSCNKYFWWIWCFSDTPGTSFYEEVGDDLKKAVSFFQFFLFKMQKHIVKECQLFLNHFQFFLFKMLCSILL